MARSATAGPVESAGTTRRAGVLLLLTAVSLLVTLSLSDPAIEEHHVVSKFIEQVERSADRAPGIYVFQVVEVARGFLVAAAGVALFLTLGGAANGFGLGGLVMFGISGVFTAGTAFIGAGTTTAAQLYSGGHLQGTGAGSSDLLAVIQVLTILHFAFFLAAFAGLGLGVAAFSRALRSSDATPRWLVGLGLASGILLCLSWLTFFKEILFLPFFFGIVLSLVWLTAMGIRLVRAR